jgi:hypothetical protein
LESEVNDIEKAKASILNFLGKNWIVNNEFKNIYFISF